MCERNLDRFLSYIFPNNLKRKVRKQIATVAHAVLPSVATIAVNGKA